MKAAIIRENFSKSKKFRYDLWSDLHFGASDFDEILFNRACTDAIKNNSKILINGDVFDAIFPTDRKRFSPSVSKFTRDDSINAIMDAAEEFFKPLANHIYLIGYGNHESACIQYNNFDPIQDLVSRLSRYRDKSLPAIQRSGYKGFIKFHFEQGEAGHAIPLILFHFHGSGGNPEITKGTISLDRLYREYVSDIYWMGHIHKSLYENSMSTTYLDARNEIKQKRKHGLITPSFKKSFQQDPIESPYERRFGEERFFTSQSSGYAVMEVDLTNKELTFDIRLKS